MSLVIVTPPAALAVSLTDMKAYLRVDHDDEDTLITMLIEAATDAVQYQTRRQLINCTRRKAWFDFKPVMALPFAPLASVTSVEYRGTNGSWATLAGSNYEVDTAATPGAIRLTTSTLPDLYEDDGPPVMDRVRCTYISGYGSAASSIPANLRTAICALVATRYTYREDIQDMSVRDIALSFVSYLSTHRIIRF